MSHIEAMKEALEALKQCASTDNEMELKAIISLRQAIAEAQPSQGDIKQKPVAWLEGETIYWHEDGGLNDWIRANGTPLYTHPQPKREWVGLTDEERFEVADISDSFEDVVDAVEAKLKEKNNG